MVISHAVALPRCGSKREAVRHTSSITSWVTSSDCAGSRITRSTRPKTSAAELSYTVAKAAWSPRATRASRGARSCPGAGQGRAAGCPSVMPTSSLSWIIRGRASFGLAYPAIGNPDRHRLRIAGVTSSPDRGGGASGWAHRGRGVATGLITAFVAIGVAQLVAGFTGPQFAPVVAVGGAAIDNAPPPLKNFAISAFGANDKRVLVAGILVVLAVFAALIGVAALHRLAYGLAGLAVFTLIGLLAALTRPDSSAIDVLPVLLGAAAGAYTMSRLVKAASATERALSVPQPAATAGLPPGPPDLPQTAGRPPGTTVAETGDGP